MTHPSRIAVTLLKIAAAYLAVNLGVGMYMGISENHALATLHSHIGLLGWATLAITGLVYLLMPSCAAHRLAAVHFWLHNAGLPIMVGALAVTLVTGDERAMPVLGMGSALVTAALACFVVNVFLNARPAVAGHTSQ